MEDKIQAHTDAMKSVKEKLAEIHEICKSNHIASILIVAGFDADERDGLDVMVSQTCEHPGELHGLAKMYQSRLEDQVDIKLQKDHFKRLEEHLGIEKDKNQEKE